MLSTVLPYNDRLYIIMIDFIMRTNYRNQTLHSYNAITKNVDQSRNHHIDQLYQYIIVINAYSIFTSSPLYDLYGNFMT